MSHLNLSLVIIAVFSLGFFLGVAFTLLTSRFSRKNQTQQLSKEMDRFFADFQIQSQQQALENLSRTTQSMMSTTETQLNQGKDNIAKELEQNKVLLDVKLNTLAEEMKKMSSNWQTAEKERHGSYSKLSTLLTQTQEQTQSLLQTTTSLREILSSSQTRGQWGERIAEDILQIAGFIENINYTKQKSLSNGERPDFTFLLPKEQKVHMDVKFPINNYRKYLECDDQQKQQHAKAFFSDLKTCIKDLNKRSYREGEDTLDYVIMLIPHEQVFAFIQEKAPDLLDVSLKANIIMCSPMTLFAVLAIMRKSMEQFFIKESSVEIIQLVQKFSDQWQLYQKSLAQVSKRFQDVEKDFTTLTTTRTNQLKKVVDNMTSLKSTTDTK